MIYSPRLKKILQYCLQREEYVSIETLANVCKTSTRTIFREIKDIDHDLKAYHVTLISKPKAGIMIEGDPEHKQQLLKELLVQGVAYMDKEERRSMLIFELLHSEELEKLVHYAGMFQVSEATISNDLDAIEPWLQHYDLTLNRKPGFGVMIKGKEKDVRRAMTAIIHQSVQQNERIQSVNYLDSSSLLHQIFIDTGSQSILKLLDQEILTRILHVFETYQHELSLDRYASVGYIGLIIHLVIAIDRILKHEAIKESEEVLQMIATDSAFLQAKKMAHYLENEFDIDIPTVEIAFIALHIKGAKIIKTQDSAYTNQLQSLIMQMLCHFDEDIKGILIQDEELINGLLTHMEPTITRLKNDLPIYNPLKETIQTMYQDVYEQTKQACCVIEDTYHCKVSEDEIAFLTMHIGASLERGRNQTKRKRMIHCGVVCASGIGVSALLSARIQKAIPEGIQLTTLSMEDITRNKYQDMELLITTFDLSQEDIDIVQVSPLLNEWDLQILIQKLKQLWKKEGKKNSFMQSNQLLLMKEASCEAVALLDTLQIHELKEDAKLSDMISYVAQCFPNQTEIKQALWQREALGSVIMEDFGFALLHAKVSSLIQPSMMLLYPSNQTWKEYPKVCFVQVMLLPQTASSIQQGLCSAMNRALIEQDGVLDALKQRKSQEIFLQFQTVAEAYIKEVLQW